MKSKKPKTNQEYNKLLKIIKIKHNQFEQEYYEELLFEQTRKLKKENRSIYSTAKKS